jgi:hypothetical protein
VRVDAAHEPDREVSGNDRTGRPPGKTDYRIATGSKEPARCDVTTTLRTLERPTYNGNGWAETPTAAAAAPLRPRRSAGRLLFGLLLAAVVVLVFVIVALRADHKQPVLAVARPVAAGAQLSAASLIVVRVAVEDGMPVVPAGQLDQMVGRTAAVPLVRGALLAPRQVGPAAWPPAGQAVLALPVKAGHAPTDLVAGSAVMVLVAPGTGSTGGQAGSPGGSSGQSIQAPATVVAVDRAADGSGATSVSLLLGQDAAVRLAGAAGGDVSLVLLAPHG